ncbi:hypothetical protein BJ742DRAFT_810864 [Cladochytrium replicatum]|nr:hypothetical protein BJ742DRAFT_810864 [Cladochytrium replicatum]
MAVNTNVPHIQDDSEGMRKKYRIRFPKNQVWGKVEVSEGLCLAFSNLYQHKEKRFERVDKTKPGHQKILAFFLVNPNKRVLSTADIPPQ